MTDHIIEIWSLISEYDWTFYINNQKQRINTMEVNDRCRLNWFYFLNWSQFGDSIWNELIPASSPILFAK